MTTSSQAFDDTRCRDEWKVAKQRSASDCSHCPPAYSESARIRHAPPLLARPVAIPRLDVAGRLAVPLPFQRAYSPALQSHGINEADFLTFIDNLAIAQAPSPPLQALNMVGMGIGQVPHLWAMATSAGLGVATGVATATVIAARTKHFLARSNKDFFGPRGLKVSIKKDPELAAMLHISNQQDSLAPAYEGGRYHCLADRRMRVLAHFVSPITTSVSLPAEQHRNILDRISAKQVQKCIKKKEKKLRKDEDKAMEDEEKEAAKESKKQRKRDRKAGLPDAVIHQNMMSNARPSKKAREQMEKDLKQVAKLDYIVVEML